MPPNPSVGEQIKLARIKKPANAINVSPDVPLMVSIDLQMATLQSAYYPDLWRHG